MQITVELAFFGASQRTSTCLCRKFVNSIPVGSRELHGEEIPGNIRRDLGLVRLDDASQNRRLSILGKDLGTHATSTTLSSHTSFESSVVGPSVLRGQTSGEARPRHQSSGTMADTMATPCSYWLLLTVQRNGLDRENYPEMNNM